MGSVPLIALHSTNFTASRNRALNHVPEVVRSRLGTSCKKHVEEVLRISCILQQKAFHFSQPTKESSKKQWKNLSLPTRQESGLPLPSQMS